MARVYFAMSDSSGTVFEGEYDTNKKYTGFGKLLYESTGIFYEGMFLDGQYHGEGTIHFPTGEKYSAYWKQGVEVKTTGLVEFSDGLVYNPVQGSEEEKKCEGVKEESPISIGLEWPYLSGSVGGHDRRFFEELTAGSKPALQLASSPAKVQTEE